MGRFTGEWNGPIRVYILCMCVCVLCKSGPPPIFTTRERGFFPPRPPSKTRPEKTHNIILHYKLCFTVGRVFIAGSSLRTEKHIINSARAMCVVVYVYVRARSVFFSSLILCQRRRRYNIMNTHTHKF